MAETGARAASLLQRILKRGALAAALRKPPFLIPLTWQCNGRGGGARDAHRRGLAARRPSAAAAPFKVERLGDGRFTATGPFYAGNYMQLGPMALIAVDGVRILLSSRKQQAADQAMFRHLGIEPAAERILALKSSVHFRADFQDLAEEILIVAAPYRRLRRGIRLMPNGPAFE